MDGDLPGLREMGLAAGKGLGQGRHLHGRENTANKQNLSSSAEVRLREAIHLTCLGRCDQLPYGFLWHPGHSARSENPISQMAAHSTPL